MDIRLFFTAFFQLYLYWEVLVIMSTSAVVVNSFYSLVSKKTFNFFDLRITLFALIFNHLFFVIGIFIYLANLLFVYWSSDHTLTINQSNILFDLPTHSLNLFSLIMITVGWSLHKNSKVNFKKFLRLFTFYSLGLTILVGKYLWLN